MVTNLDIGLTANELKTALTHLAETDPDFLAELIGKVVKSNLTICEQQVIGGFSSSERTASPELRWGFGRDSEWFSCM